MKLQEKESFEKQFKILEDYVNVSINNLLIYESHNMERINIVNMINLYDDLENNHNQKKLDELLSNLGYKNIYSLIALAREEILKNEQIIESDYNYYSSIPNNYDDYWDDI